MLLVLIERPPCKTPPTTPQEWLKPIMFSGGLGQIDHRHLHKADGEVRARSASKMALPFWRAAGRLPYKRTNQMAKRYRASASIATMKPKRSVAS